jgi:hypothetical protein
MKLRPVTILIDEHDPCKLCLNQSDCLGGCVGFKPLERIIKSTEEAIHKQELEHIKLMKQATKA